MKSRDTLKKLLKEARNGSIDAQEELLTEFIHHKYQERAVYSLAK